MLKTEKVFKMMPWQQVLPDILQNLINCRSSFGKQLLKTNLSKNPYIGLGCGTSTKLKTRDGTVVKMWSRYSTVSSIYAFLCFAVFAKNLKIQNGRHFGSEIFFLKIGMATLQIPGGPKILSKSLYLARFSRYKHFCVLQFLRKTQKFKMAAILGETKIF